MTAFRMGLALSCLQGLTRGGDAAPALLVEPGRNPHTQKPHVLQRVSEWAGDTGAVMKVTVLVFTYENKKTGLTC